jgi:hypothetical protein
MLSLGEGSWLPYREIFDSWLKCSLWLYYILFVYSSVYSIYSPIVYKYLTIYKYSLISYIFLKLVRRSYPKVNLFSIHFTMLLDIIYRVSLK